VRFENKKNHFLKNAQAYYNAGVVAVNSEVVGLAPGLFVLMPCNNSYEKIDKDLRKWYTNPRCPKKKCFSIQHGLFRGG
jgi:hypothetical protein